MNEKLKSMSILDEDYSVDGAYVENYMLFKEVYGRGANAVLVLTGNCPFHDAKDDFNFVTKYIDLSDLKEGDYDRYMGQIAHSTFDGIMLDNIDRIPDNKDKEFWQEFVRFALKKEMDFPLNQTTGATCGVMDFDKLHVAARNTGGFPEYLRGKSIQCSVIDVITR